MNITQEQIFKVKKQLQEQITEFEAKLTEHIAAQAKLTKIEKLAQSILEYDKLEYEIASRAHLFALFSQPPESMRSPFVKAQFFSYIEAAETIGTEMVDFLVNDFITQIKADVSTDEDDSTDLIQAEYKEHIIPGKIIAEKFDEIDDLIEEMNRYCKALEPAYDESSATQVMEYGIRKSITADTKMEPTISAIKEKEFMYLTPEARAKLLEEVTEHLSILDYKEAKNQTLAMDKAVEMIAKKEAKTPKKKAAKKK